MIWNNNKYIKVVEVSNQCLRKKTILDTAEGLIRIGTDRQVGGSDCGEQAKTMCILCGKQVVNAQAAFHLVGKNSKVVMSNILHEGSLQHVRDGHKSHKTHRMSCKMFRRAWRFMLTIYCEQQVLTNLGRSNKRNTKVSQSQLCLNHDHSQL